MQLAWSTPSRAEQPVADRADPASPRPRPADDQDRNERGKRNRRASNFVRQAGGAPPNRPVDLRRYAPAVTQRLFDADEWDARSQALDSSEGSGLRTDLASVDPTLVSADPYHAWLLTVNGAIITVLHDGWACTRGGERLDLVERLSGGASYADLAALVTRRPAAARRPPGMPSS